MAAIRHLEFQELEFLTVGTVDRVNVRHCAKFRGNPYGDFSIFSEWRTSAVLDLL